MRVLALDTSTSQGGVAIVDDSKILARAVWRREKSHSEFLTPTIEDVLRTAQLTLADMDAFAVGQGPGSFTGIRIGVNVVRSLGYALQKPIYAFNTLELLAAGVARQDLPVLALVNAHKNLLFTALFDAAKGQWQPRSAIRARTLEEVAGLVQEPILCVGDGYLEYENFFPLELKRYLIRDVNVSDEPLPETLGRLAVAQSKIRQPLDWNALQALYIRASGAEESLETKQR